MGLQAWVASAIELVIGFLQSLLYVVCGVERRIGSHGTAMERLVEETWPDGEVELETHHVLTTDGYELVLHRLIPADAAPGRELRPVLLQHGLFENSIVWVAGKEDSLAGRLLQEGHEVWLGNARGNALSSGAWGLWGKKSRDWSFEDRARNDFPIMVEYVLGASGADKLQFFGQSQGAALPVVGLSLCPALNEKIADLVLLAPAVHIRRPVNPIMMWCLDHFPMVLYRCLYPIIALVHCVVPDAILVPIGKPCMRAMGWVNHAYDEKSIATLLHAVPSGGTSDANMLQLLQLVAHGGSMPQVNIKNVTCPVHCYLGACDDVIDKDATCEMMQQAPNLKTLHIQEGYAHVDFVWTVDAPKTIYGPLIQSLRRRAEVGSPTEDVDVDVGESTPRGTGERKSFILGSRIVKNASASWSQCRPRALTVVQRKRTEVLDEAATDKIRSRSSFAQPKGEAVRRHTMAESLRAAGA